MPRYPQAEESYFSNDEVLNLLARQGQMQRDQIRWAAEENARAAKENSLADAVGGAVQTGVDQYNKSSEQAQKDRETQARADQAKADSDFNHQKFAAEEAHQKTQEDLAQKNYQINQGQFALQGQKQRVELASNAYAQAKTPEDIENLDKVYGKSLSPGDLAAAKAAGAATAAKAIKVPSDAEKSAAIYAKKAKESNDVLAQLEDPKVGNYHPEDYGRAMRDLPLIGKVTKSQGDRQYDAAQKEFLAAILRKESGGAITPAEFSEYGSMYFPQPGDDKNTMNLKKAARERAIGAMVAAGGDAYKSIPDTSFQVVANKDDHSVVPSANAAPESSAKTVARKQYSASQNKTKFIYSDGSEEIVDGKK